MPNRCQLPRTATVFSFLWHLEQSMNFPGSYGISEGQSSIKLVQFTVFALSVNITCLQIWLKPPRLPISRPREWLDAADAVPCFPVVFPAAHYLVKSADAAVTVQAIHVALWVDTSRLALVSWSRCCRRVVSVVASSLFASTISRSASCIGWLRALFDLFCIYAYRTRITVHLYSSMHES